MKEDPSQAFWMQKYIQYMQNWTSELAERSHLSPLCLPLRGLYNTRQPLAAFVQILGEHWLSFVWRAQILSYSLIQSQSSAVGVQLLSSQISLSSVVSKEKLISVCNSHNILIHSAVAVLNGLLAFDYRWWRHLLRCTVFLHCLRQIWQCWFGFILFSLPIRYP